MTGLVDVFAAWFRSFGYAARPDANVQGASGSHHQIPLLLERDGRRVAVYAWVRPAPPPGAFLDGVRSACRDTGTTDALVLSLAPVADNVRASLHRDGVQVWEPRRLVQELGEAVLAETCPEVWPRVDPLGPAGGSRLVDSVLESLPGPATPPSTDPLEERPFPVEAAPMLAAPQAQAPTPFEVPPAFGFLDLLPAPAAPATAVPPPVFAAPPQATPDRLVLRRQVSKALALSLVRKRLRTVDQVTLRLVPYHVYDYEANLLVDGSLDAQTRTGRMAVNAALKRVQDWSTPLETGPLDADGVDVDEKKVRVAPEEAEHALRQELVKLVTRDVVHAEDGDDWSVVVKKKVTLAPNDVQLRNLGLYWAPVWRLAGRDGSVEIDAVSGNVAHEEILRERSDAQLV